jgi:TetR/AcrR family tetracycline transcriptional repressor
MSRASVADAALAVADRAGFDAVTMRATAAEVGATPMALYAYFEGKNALYAGMRERVLALVFAACVPRGTWQSTIEGLARGLYDVIRKHPNWAPVMAHHSGPASAGLSYIDESLGLMLKDGFGLDAAAKAYLCAVSFAVGSALSEHFIMGAGDGSAKFLSQLKGLPVRTPGRYGNLAALAAGLDGFPWDSAFELGIRSLLKGIETLAPPAKGRPRA